MMMMLGTMDAIMSDEKQKAAEEIVLNNNEKSSIIWNHNQDKHSLN